MTRRGRWLAADSELLRFRGAVSLQHGSAGWVAPWRVPYPERVQYFPRGGVGRAAMPAGVRVCVRTDSPWLRCRYEADPPPPVHGPQETARLDVLCDGDLAATAELDTTGRPAEFALTGLSPADKLMELCLPAYNQFRLYGIELAEDASVEPDPTRNPRWVHYGSSISQGRGAPSPSRAWPALVARQAGLDLTNLSMGAACHLQPMFARLMRDLPADLLSCCIGINIHAHGSLNEHSFADNLIGFVRVVRESHADVPFLIMSTIHAPEREQTPGPAGLTLRQYRAEIARVVELLRDHGDSALHYVDGLELFGPDQEHLMLETTGTELLHLNAEGHVRFADRFQQRLPTVIGADRTA